jgi:hypothetical protein
VSPTDSNPIFEPNGAATFAGQSGLNLLALKVPELEYGFGAAKRKFPTGGCANGMPKYSETSGCHDAAWPVTLPLVVFTVLPTVQAVVGACGTACIRL